MSDNVLITLIITLAILVVLILFRNQLNRFFFKAGREGVEASLETHKVDKNKKVPIHPDVEASRNVQHGVDNTISLKHKNAQAHDNRQTGKGNKIDISGDK